MSHLGVTEKQVAFKNNNTIPTYLKFGYCSVMIWACFSSKGPGELEIIDGRMKGRIYREILEKKTSSNLLIRLDMDRVFVLC